MGRWKPVWLSLGLLVITLAIYSPVRGFDFLNYDDNYYVTENARVLQGMTRENVVWAFKEPHYSMWHPLTTLSHLADVEWFGKTPGPPHVINAVLHAVNAALLFLLLWRLTGKVWASLFVAAVFAWHPLRVESVAWISERKDVLSGFFSLLTLHAYAHYAVKINPARYALLIAAYALTILTKPMVVTLPCVLVLLDFWPLRRIDFDQERKAIPGKLWLLIREKLPLFGLSILLSVLTYQAQKGGGVLMATETRELSNRLANGVVSYVRYLGKLFWPADLVPYYPLPVAWPVWQVAMAILILTLITVAVLVQLRKRPVLFTGWFWFLGTLVPVLGIIQAGSQAIADRYTYIPLLGIVILITWSGVEWLTRKPKLAVPIATSGVVVVVACIGLTCGQLKHWRNSETLFAYTAMASPGNAVAHSNLAHEYARQKRIDEAIVHYQASIRALPNNPATQNNLGLLLAEKGRHVEAIESYRAALAASPTHTKARNNLALSLAEVGDIDGAIAAYEELLRAEPGYTKAHINLGTMLARKGRLEEAVAHYSAAVQQQPDIPEGRAALATALFRSGKHPESWPHFEAAIRLRPNQPALQANWAASLAAGGKIPEAIGVAREALQKAEASGQGKLAETIRGRIAEYERVRR